MRPKRILIGTLLAWTMVCGGEPAVTWMRVPQAGIQPQMAVDEAGGLHLIYFHGEPASGDLYYTALAAGDETFGKSIRVNSVPGSAMAVGTIRGAQMALGRDGRVHVSWMGAKATEGADGSRVHPMMYARMNDAGTGFEAERNLLQWTAGVDGGGSVAADGTGQVYVAWHGKPADAEGGEFERAVYVAKSSDDGQIFQREFRANPKPTGSCACCGMRLFVDGADALHVLYRAANPKSRDMLLLTSADRGESFSMANISQWPVQSCPMSSSAMAVLNDLLLAATEIGEGVRLDRVRPGGGAVNSIATVPRAKHPRLAVDPGGTVLMTWAEGAGWGRGGTLRWALWSPEGELTKEGDGDRALPAWSFAAVATRKPGSFLIVY